MWMAGGEGGDSVFAPRGDEEGRGDFLALGEARGDFSALGECLALGDLSALGESAVPRGDLERVSAVTGLGCSTTFTWLFNKNL